MKQIQTHRETRLLPLTEIKPRSLVVVTNNRETIAKRIGGAPGGTWGEVIKSWHSGQGRMTIVVKHDRAPHPSGLQQFDLDATERYVAKRAI